ncbi:MAG: response regulator transcription factor, partial [Nitrospiraceae bacterium]
MAMEIIQIIEDDPAHASLLDHVLRQARYRTNVAHDGQIGLSDVKRLNPALVLLDVMLPGMDGHEVCRQVRADPHTQNIPIVMITALASEDHRVAGLELGADDYITKPFSPREVVSRVRAVLRRGRLPANSKEVYLDGELTLEGSCFIVSVRGKRVQLSGPEWWLLRRLAEQAGKVVTREELILLLWGEDELIHQHELDRSVQTLKRKLEEGAGLGGTIVTVPGIGYL